MIKIQNLTPEIYSKQSRDFQFIERLFDIVLNSVKTNAENLYTLPLSANTDEHLIDLMALTLGFKSRHHYNVKQLTALCSAFYEVLRNKGTLYSLELAGNALLHSEGIPETLFVEPDLTNPNLINIFIPQDLSDTNLLKDLLIYILPAGIGCNIIRELKTSTSAMTKLGAENAVVSYPTLDRVTSIVPKVEQLDLNTLIAKDTPGLIVNTTVIRPIEPGN